MTAFPLAQIDQARFAAIRLIATDIDDTLLRSDQTISPRTADLIQQVQAVGKYFVLATARPPRSIRPLAREIGARGLVIACNGALIFDLERDVIVQQHAIAPEVAQRAIHTVRAALPGVVFGCEAGMRFGCESGYEDLRPIAQQQGAWRADALVFTQTPLTKLMVLHPTLVGEALLAVVAPLVGAEVICSYSGSPIVEINAAGVDKATGLAELCQSLGIPASAVIACGDMPNDIAMLRWAGLGVAVANAHPDVLAAADTRTSHHNEDGVARVLERVLMG